MISDPLSVDDAKAIVDAVTSVPGVKGMHAGTFGEVSLLYPGERVRGLHIDDGRLDVHVVVDLAALDQVESLPALSDTIRASIPTTAGVSAIDIIMADAE